MKSPVAIAGVPLLLCGLGVTLADGLLHGWLTYRWTGAPASRLEAGRRLREIPAACGDWEQSGSEPLDDYVTKILQCEAHLNRSYVNRVTGEKVRVTIILGPFGPTSTHTPDMCYQSREFRIRRDRYRATIATGEGATSELWVVTVQSQRVEGETLSVYYGWSDGGQWQAPRVPRVSFGGRPFLYKIQASSAVLSGAVSPSRDACLAFLESFLPAIQPYLVEARR